MLRILALSAILTFPVAAQQTAQQVMTTAMQKQAARQAGISNYVVIQSTGVMQAPAYYEKENIGGQELFRLVPMSEWQKRRPSAIQDPGAFIGAMGDGIDMLRGPMQEQMSGSPGGALLGGYLANMMSDWSTFAHAASEAEDHISDGRTEARSKQDGLAVFGSRARLVGREEFESVESFHLLADNLSDIALEQPEDGGTVTMIDANLWLDVTDYLPRRMLMHVMVENDGKRVPITIETSFHNYQQKGTLQVATRQQMRISGLMEAMAVNSEDRKKLEKARRDAEEIRTKMASIDMTTVPPGARAMVEAQISKAMQQLEMLTNEGAFVAEMTFRIFTVDQGPPYDWKPTPMGGG